MLTLLIAFGLIAIVFLSLLMSVPFSCTLLTMSLAWAVLTVAQIIVLPLWALIAISSIAGLWLSVLWIKPLRLSFVSSSLCRWFVTQLPSISPVEEMVLDAGGTWWEKEIFSAKPDLDSIMGTTISPLTHREQQFLNNEVDTLCSMLNEWEINNQDKDLPQAAWDYIRTERFWAISLSQRYGGLGFSQAAHSAIVTKIASRSISAAYTVMVPNSLGPAELIDYCGTEEQKAHYLPRFSEGKEIGCFGLTSLHAGSDAASIPDTGVICRGHYNNDEVLGIRLHFSKRYITLAPVATMVGLAFQLSDPEGLLTGNAKDGITVAVVPSSHPGISIGKRHSPMTLGFMNGPIEGKDVFIPLDWVIGGQDNCGHGWKILMGCLSVGRGISMPALSTAVAQQCMRMTGPYAAIREQFKMPVGDFEGVQEKLATIGGLGYLIEATRYCLAQAVEDGARPSVGAAIAKYHLTELSRDILKASMDIHSGHALQAGPSNLLAEVYNGIPISTVGEGANIMTRNLIIFGQGVMRAHPYVRQSILSATKADVDHTQLIHFDRALFKHVRWSLSCWTRGFCYGLFKGKLITVGRHPLADAQQKIRWFSNAFTCVSDIALLKLGRSLKMKESISARLGDILSYLTLATCIVKYAHDHLEKGDKDELVYAQWSLDYCFYQIERGFTAFFDNFAYRGWSRLLRSVFFPFGMRCPYPKDKLSHCIAKSMQEKSDIRDRLTRFCFVGIKSNDPVGRIEAAWDAVLQVKSLHAKIGRAIKLKKISRQLTREDTLRDALGQNVIDEKDFERLIHVENLRDQALVVDEFDFSALVRFNANMPDTATID